MSKFEDLERLAEMLDQGKVTQAEYERLKAELLAEPSAVTSDPAASPPAGWYDDPHGVANQQAYWDGQRWTGASRTPAAKPEQIGSAPAGWYDDPHGVPNQQAYWDGEQWTGATHTPPMAQVGPSSDRRRWYNRPRNWVLIVVGLLVLGAAFGPRDESDDGRASNNATVTTSRATTPRATEPATTQPPPTTTTEPGSTTTAPPVTTLPADPEAAIESLVISTLGEAYVDTMTFEQVDGGYGVEVTMNVGDNLTMGLIADGFEADAGAVMIELYGNNPELDVQWVLVHGLFPLTDQYGNTETGEVVTIRLPRDEAIQVNWSLDEAYLKLTILPGLYEWLFVHPEMREHLP